MWGIKVWLEASSLKVWHRSRIMTPHRRGSRCRRSEGSWCIHRQSCEVRAVPADLSLQQHRCEKLRTHKVQLYSFLNSALDGSEWPPLPFGWLTTQERMVQYQSRSGRFGEEKHCLPLRFLGRPQCRREGLAVRKGARGPTVWHNFFSLLVVSFFRCTD
jgi:hypothetical protein